MNSNYSCTGTKIKFSTTVQCTSVNDERLSLTIKFRTHDGCVFVQAFNSENLDATGTMKKSKSGGLEICAKRWTSEKEKSVLSQVCTEKVLQTTRLTV